MNDHWSSSSSSSSWCRAASTDIPDPLSPLLPIVHRFWQVIRATSRILTELLYVGSSWSSCFCSAIWGGPYENITYELVPASPAVSCMSGSSNFDSFRDEWSVAEQLVLCGVLPPGLVGIKFIYIYIYIRYSVSCFTHSWNPASQTLPSNIHIPICVKALSLNTIK